MKEAKSQSWVESTFPKDIHQNGLPEMQKKKKASVVKCVMCWGNIADYIYILGYWKF